MIHVHLGINLQNKTWAEEEYIISIPKVLQILFILFSQVNSCPRSCHGLIYLSIRAACYCINVCFSLLQIRRRSATNNALF